MTEREILLVGEPGLLWLFRRAAAMINLGHKLSDSQRERTIKRVMAIVAIAFIFLNIRSHTYYINQE